MKCFSVIIIAAFLNLTCKPALSQESASIERIDKKMKASEWTISQVLGADSLMYLHSKTPFRNMIKSNAKEGWFSMITNNEPGTSFLSNVSGTGRCVRLNVHSLVRSLSLQYISDNK